MELAISAIIAVAILILVFVAGYMAGKVDQLSETIEKIGKNAKEIESTIRNPKKALHKAKARHDGKTKVGFYSQLTPEERKDMDDTTLQKLKKKIWMPK